MIILSDEFAKVSKGVYAFSFSCIVIKFLPIESISAAGFRIDVENKNTIAGALGLALIFSTASCMILLLRDYYLTRISDDVSDQELGTVDDIDFSKSSADEVRRLERHAKRYEALSWAGFALVGLGPAALGVVTTMIVWPDMVGFLKNIVEAGS